MKSLLKAHKNPEMTNSNYHNRENNNRDSTRDNTRDNYRDAKEVTEAKDARYNRESKDNRDSNYIMDNLPENERSEFNIRDLKGFEEITIIKAKSESEVNSLKFPSQPLKHNTGNFTLIDNTNNYDLSIKNEIAHENKPFNNAIDIITKANNYGDAFKLTGNESQDVLKLKIANENLLEQVNMLKKKVIEDKARYENSLNLTLSQAKNKESESLAFVERLRDRHKSEIALLEESHRIKVKALDEETKKTKMEVDLVLFSEKERLAFNFQTDLENANVAFKKSLQNQKEFANTQINELRKQLDQQLELHKIVNKVDLNSKNIEEIVEKYANEKYKTLEVDKEIYESKQRTLKEFEEILHTKEKLYKSDLAEFKKRKKDLDEADKLKHKEFAEEKERIEKELKRLQDLQNSMRSLELSIKEKTEKDKLEVLHRENQKNIEIDSLRTSYNEKMNELDYKQKVLEDDKNYFKDYKEEFLK